MYCKSINCFIHLQLILIQPEDRKSTSVTLKPGKYFITFLDLFTMLRRKNLRKIPYAEYEINVT